QGPRDRGRELQDARNARRRDDPGPVEPRPGRTGIGVGGRTEAGRGLTLRPPATGGDAHGSTTMNAMNEMPAPLVFTDAAAEKVRALIEEEGNPELKLRVFVTGGGCSGFQYGFTFDETAAED